MRETITESVTLDEILAESVRTIDAVDSIRRADRSAAFDAAERRPRVVSAALKRLTELATVTASSATACIYSVPRGGKRLTGPSVRFAEMAAAAWGSIDVKTTIVSVGDDAVIVSGRAHDLETNTIVEVDTRRPVARRRDTGKADDDMRQLAVAVATSLAFRNAVLRIIPRAILEDVLEAIKKAATGRGTLSERRQSALSVFAELGATPGQVLAAIGRAEEIDITLDDLVYLRGLVTAIRDGGVSLSDALRPQAERDITRRRAVASRAPEEPTT